MSKLILGKLVASSIVLFCCAVPGWAENSVFIGSMSALPGESSVIVGVYITNDVPLMGMVLPFEFRQVTEGAYITNSVTLTLAPGGRVAQSGLTDFTIQNYYPTPEDVNTCSGPISHTFTDIGSVDFVSPDGVSWTGNSFLSPALFAGSDGAPGGPTPSFLLTFDVTNTDGIFEIDTCCIGTSGLVFVRDGTAQPIYPSFTKGVVTIGTGSCCVGPMRGDINGDGSELIDIADLVHLISFMFQGGPPPICDDEGNIDGLEGIDMSDLVMLIDYMFLGGAPPTDCP